MQNTSLMRICIHLKFWKELLTCEIRKKKYGTKNSTQEIPFYSVTHSLTS